MVLGPKRAAARRSAGRPPLSPGKTGRLARSGASGKKQDDGRNVENAVGGQHEALTITIRLNVFRANSAGAPGSDGVAPVIDGLDMPTSSAQLDRMEFSQAVVVDDAAKAPPMVRRKFMMQAAVSISLSSTPASAMAVTGRSAIVP
jgi:hypothetical protein